LKRSVSAIYDELARNETRGRYGPIKAHHQAYVRRKYSKYQGMKIVKNPGLREFVEKELLNDQSPTNISGRIKKHEKCLLPVSKNIVYKYIKSPYGRRIEHHRNKQKNRRRRRRRGSSKKLQGRTFIDKRPQYINERQRIGDAEADFLVSGRSGKGIILNITGRKSRAAFLEQIIAVTIDNVHLSFKRIKKRFPELKTITTDNDLPLERHKELEKLLKIKIYFCHQYHSWEKGTVENSNKYVRRDIPKGSDISKYSKRFTRFLERKLQRRYMNCLDHFTPAEMLENHRKRKKRRSVKEK